MPEYEFRHANAEEARLLRPLWQECFGDDAQFMACYEAQMFRPERVELALLNGEAVSMLTILPMTLCRDGKRMPGGCVYGVATRSDHRGRGLATQLLQAACRRLDHEVDCLAVVPDTPELFPYYSRTMLARTAFYVREIQLHAEQLTDRSPLNPQPAKAEDYLAARRDCLRGHTFLDWDRQAVYFQRQICRQEGGDLFLFSGIPGCAAVQRNDSFVCQRVTGLHEQPGGGGSSARLVRRDAGRQCGAIWYACRSIPFGRRKSLSGI